MAFRDGKALFDPRRKCVAARAPCAAARVRCFNEPRAAPTMAERTSQFNSLRCTMERGRAAVTLLFRLRHCTSRRDGGTSRRGSYENSLGYFDFALFGARRRLRFVRRLDLFGKRRKRGL